MPDITALVAGLRDKDHNAAYGRLKQLLAESEASDAVYAHFDAFADMLRDESSYVRTRGLMLISANARWDADNRIDEVVDEYLTHITDEKPITSRQCIKALPELARRKPELAADIREALLRADPGIYPDSMAPLVAADIQKALREIERSAP